MHDSSAYLPTKFAFRAIWRRVGLLCRSRAIVGTASATTVQSEKLPFSAQMPALLRGGLGLLLSKKSAEMNFGA